MRPVREDAALSEIAWLRRVAERVAGRARAEDLAQDTVVAALRARRPTGDRRRWLAGILRNLARQELRTRARRARREAAAARPDTTAPVVRQVEEAELRRRVRAAVEELPEPYRAAVAARHLEGRSCAAVARAEGVPASTLRNRLRRGLMLLRDRLARAYDGDPRALSLLFLLPRRPGSRRLAMAGGLLALCCFAVPAAAAPAPVDAPEAVRGDDPAPVSRDGGRRPPAPRRAYPPGVVVP